MFSIYKFKQEALLRRALNEKKINHRKLEIKIDHISGFNWVNGVKTGIIYPESFFLKTSKLNEKKIYEFYFNGNMSTDGGRNELLKKFKKFERAEIIESNFGRNKFFKSFYNSSYYRGLAAAKYGLCPHQMDWNGPKETMWTYRFIECCFVGAAPVLFRKTPLGGNFIEGFKYFYDDEFHNVNKFPDFTIEDTEHNRALAGDRFLLNKTLINEIMGSL